MTFENSILAIIKHKCNRTPKSQCSYLWFYIFMIEFDVILFNSFKKMWIVIKSKHLIKITSAIVQHSHYIIGLKDDEITRVQHYA